MTPDLKSQLMACFVFVACHAPAAHAGFFDDLRTFFGAPPAQAPVPEAEPKTPPAPAAKPVPQQPKVAVITKPAQQPQQQPSQQQAANAKPTVKAEPDKPPGQITQKELDELLWLAALQGNSGRIRGLVEQGANPMSGTRHGETPLHVAASRGHLKPIIYLANNGGSVNARTRNGWTPLHHAARFGHYEAVRYLLHMGAIPHIRTSDQGRKSPMEMAVDNGYMDIATGLFGYRPK